MCVRACVSAGMWACMRDRARACVHACVRVRTCLFVFFIFFCCSFIIPLAMCEYVNRMFFLSLI